MLSKRTDVPESFSPGIAWAAGFCDGEGCIHIARQVCSRGRGEAFSLRLHVTQNCPRTLLHFQATVGGRGKLYATQRQLNHRKQCYTLNFDGLQAFKVIEELRPHLVRKRVEADLAREYWINGMGGVKFGRRGVPDDIHQLRSDLYLRMQSVK